MVSPQYPRLSEVPDYLATRFELRSWGLRPGGPPVAIVTVIARVSGVARQEKLYRVTEAVAVTPVPSPGATHEGSHTYFRKINLKDGGAASL